MKAGEAATNRLTLDTYITAASEPQADYCARAGREGLRPSAHRVRDQGAGGGLLLDQTHRLE